MCMGVYGTQMNFLFRSEIWCTSDSNSIRQWMLMLYHRKTPFLLLGCSGTYLKALPQQDHSLSPCVFSSLPWTLGILSTSPSSVAVSLIFLWGSCSPPHRHSSPSTDSLGHVLLFPTGYPLSGRKPFVNGTGCWIHHVNSLDPRYGVCVF